MNPEGFLDVVTKHKELSLLLFTGSSKVLEDIYSKVGSNLAQDLGNFVTAAEDGTASDRVELGRELNALQKRNT